MFPATKQDERNREMDDALSKAPPIFEVRIAQTEAEVKAAQTLRYQVFVEELGANGPLVDHHSRLEIDSFDAHADQLILLDLTRKTDDQVVGVYRLLDQAGAQAAGQFYSENEYDLSSLKSSGRTLLELGRSCLHSEYRGGPAMLHLWQALAKEVDVRGAEILFGVASFHGVALKQLAPSLSLLARDYLAPPHLRVRARHYQPMNIMDDIDRVSAMKQIPSLIKAYLRLGGFVGDGAFLDHAFNTTDVCLILDTSSMNPRQRAIYGGGR